MRYTTRKVSKLELVGPVCLLTGAEGLAVSEVTLNEDDLLGGLQSSGRSSVGEAGLE